MVEYINYIFLTITIVQIVIVFFWVYFYRGGDVFKINFQFFLFLIFFFGIISYLLNSRFFFLCSTFGIFFFAKIGGIKIKPYISILFLSGCALLFLVKPASSSGRLFIYKLSISKIYQDLFKKVDSVSYNSMMNHVQADYFRTNGMNSNDAMLADNIYYGFNEWLAFSVKYGVFGFIISILVLLIIFAFYLNHLKKQTINSTTLWLALLLPILISSFVSYPFENPIILIEIGCLLFLILFDLFLIQKTFFHISTILRLSIVLFSLGTIILLFYKDFTRKQKIEKVELLIREGQKKNAELFIRQEFEIPTDRYVTPLYADLQYARGNENEAIQLLLAHHAFQCNSSFHSSLGKWYWEIGDSVNAEQNLLDALYIVPHKLSSRYVLIEFYAHYGNIGKALYWANELILFPAKIKTDNADVLKQKAKYFIENGKLLP